MSEENARERLRDREGLWTCPRAGCTCPGPRAQPALCHAGREPQQLPAALLRGSGRQAHRGASRQVSFLVCEPVVWFWFWFGFCFHFVFPSPPPCCLGAAQGDGQTKAQWDTLHPSLHSRVLSLLKRQEWRTLKGGGPGSKGTLSRAGRKRRRPGGSFYFPCPAF